MILKVFPVFLDKLLLWIYHSQLPDIKVESANLDEGEVLNTKMPENYSGELSDSLIYICLLVV